MWSAVVLLVLDLGLQMRDRHNLAEIQQKPMPPIIGYVEDEDVIRENYSELLRSEGYTVHAFSDRHSAFKSFSQSEPDLVLIDISLNDEPDGGFHLLRNMRRQLSLTLPIVFFTSHDNEIDQVAGLQLGADDYVDKNTSFPLLLARMGRLLRRNMDLKENASAEHYSHGDLEVNKTMLTVKWKGQLVDLPLTQFWIVDCLARNPGHPKSYDALMDAAKLVVTRNAVSVYIKNIRKSFLTIDPTFDCLKTERGLGYRWVSN